MKKIAKRTAALLCVLMILSSMLMIPAQAANWTFQFGANSGSSSGYYYSDSVKTVTISKSSTRWGTWTPVYFRFKGSGIQRVQLTTWYTNQSRPVEAYIKYVNWKAAGQWCYACVMVRGQSGGTGRVDVYLFGSDAVCRAIYIQ